MQAIAECDRLCCSYLHAKPLRSVIGYVVRSLAFVLDASHCVIGYVVRSLAFVLDASHCGV